MSAVPWNQFHFMGYVIAISLLCCIVAMDTLIFFCTMTGLLPMYVRSWHKKIRVYSIVMAILGISLTIFGVVALKERSTEEQIFDFMKIMWEHRDMSDTKVEAEKFWDDIQVDYKCCGLNSDYNYNSVPESCCANDVKYCSIDNAYRISCFDAVKGYHGNVLVTILATFAFATSFVCIVLIILAQLGAAASGLVP